MWQRGQTVRSAPGCRLASCTPMPKQHVGDGHRAVDVEPLLLGALLAQVQFLDLPLTTCVRWTVASLLACMIRTASVQPPRSRRARGLAASDRDRVPCRAATCGTARPAGGSPGRACRSPMARRSIFDHADDLGGRAGQEHLVGGVQVVARQHVLAHRRSPASAASSMTTSRVMPSSAPRRRRRRDQRVALDDEDVVARGLGHVALRVEHDRFHARRR